MTPRPALLPGAGEAEAAPRPFRRPIDLPDRDEGGRLVAVPEEGGRIGADESQFMPHATGNATASALRRHHGARRLHPLPPPRPGRRPPLLVEVVEQLGGAVAAPIAG